MIKISGSRYNIILSSKDKKVKYYYILLLADSVYFLILPLISYLSYLHQDTRGEQAVLSSALRRKATNKTKQGGNNGGNGSSGGSEKPRLFDELQQYDSHARKEKQKNKDKHGVVGGGNKNSSKYICHEYKELR